MKNPKEIKERIDFEKEMAHEAEKLEEKHGYPKINSTAHFQRAAILEWVLTDSQNDK